MADQLNLGFDLALPRAGGVAPMWPVPRRDPFDSADHLFEPTWGGLRVLVFLQPSGGVRVVDSSSTDLAARLPELGGMHGAVDARSAVIDGELVAVDGNGRADGAALRARLAGEPVRPVSLLAFDLLHHNGTWLLGKPLDARRALLRKVMADGDAGVVVPVIAGEGRALYAAVASQGIAGVLARSRTSPYLPGVRSRLWRSIVVRAADATAPDDHAEPPEPEPGRRAGPPVLTVLRRLPLDLDAG
jgi:bifunctional non-homologous end joining protein LigD